MIKGNRAAAYGTTLDQNFRKIEIEYRQCSHCQFTWPYLPGSGRKVGMCSHCLGLLCSKCVKLRWKQVDSKCLPFYDITLENSDKYKLDENLGIYLRK